MTFTLRNIVAVTLLLTGMVVHGQDLHFTQFNMAPLSFNPALTGGFYGSLRVGGVYRDQWSGVYNTPALSFDSPIVKGFRKQDWIGVGMFMFSDESESEYIPFNAGSSRRGTLTTSAALPSAAYHLALDKDRNTVIALGIQGGTVSKRLDGEFQFEDAILSGSPSQDQPPTGENENKTYLDISAGLTITGKIENGSYYRVGLSALHVNQPRAGVLAGGSANSRFPMKMVAYGTYYADLNDQFLFTPSILFQNLGPARELALQGMLGYKIPTESTVLKGGLGYRAGDAIQVLLGIDYKDLRVGASYDLTASQLSRPNNAFELGVAYIAKIYKRPKVDPVIFCPRF